MNEIKPIKLWYSFFIFASAGIVFYLIIRILVPHLTNLTQWHVLLLWSITGCFLLFLPLFILSLILLKKDGYKLTFRNIKKRFRLKRLTKRDIFWTIIGILSFMIMTGLLVFIWTLLSNYFGFGGLKDVTPFIEFEPLQGKERFILFAWLILFFFNIFGEEFLWRGYILPRQEISYGKYSWFINAILHSLVHICFGFPLIILLIPLLLVIPYIVYKTKNTYTGIIIHAIINGPSFILISLGIISW